MFNARLQRKSQIRVSALYFAFLFLGAIFAPKAFGQGQAVFASLSGDVRDATGAVVSGAGVTLANNQIDFRRVFTTDASGRYVFSQIPPGTYTLRIEQKGFRTYV